MKVALVRPNYNSHLITPPLGLGYLSGYLKSKQIDVSIIDGLNEGSSEAQLLERCADADIIGITCMSAYFLETISLSRSLKALNKTVVIGGPHPTALPDLTLQQTGADFVVKGEGELALWDILRGGRDAIIESKFVDELDSLPLPDWGGINPTKYKKAPHGGLIRRFPVAPVITSRGCPYECSFCASPKIWQRRIRFRSPEAVVDEIEHLMKEYGVKEIHFEDDNLTLNRNHIERICESILKRRLRLSWATPNGIRIDTVDYDLLSLMKKSGCYYVAFGIESGCPDILKRSVKHIDLKTIVSVAQAAKKVGLLTQGFFVLGLPGETKATAHQTIRFAKSLPIDRAQFLLLDVLPGSLLWDQLNGEFDIDWRRSSYHETTWIPPGFTKGSLEKMQVRAFREFFLRPNRLFSLIRYFRLSQVPFIMRRLKDFRII